MKQELLERIGILLLKKGFTVKYLVRSCFDILARKEAKILLIKVLEDANSISREYAEEMRRIAMYIKASAHIICEKAGEKLLDNVVYSRFGVLTLNFNTFKNCLENRMPFISRNRAGLVAKVVGEKLRRTRESEGIPLSAISRKLSVSRRMVLKYEHGTSEITINKAVKLYQLFGDSVFKKIDVFSQNQEAAKPYEANTDVAKKYEELGFEASDTRKVPFDVIARKEKEVILTEVGDKTRPGFDSISKLIDANSLVIFEKKKPRNIPSLTKEEFLDFEKANELLKFLKEFE